MLTAVASASSTAAIAVTAGVGVWGQAAAVRPCRTSMPNLIPNGSAAPPHIPAAIRADAQTIPLSATRPQHTASTAQQPTVPAGTKAGRGPSARVTAHHRRDWATFQIPG